MAESSHIRAGQMGATALWYEAPGRVGLRPETVDFGGAVEDGPCAIVRTLWSAISRGTERLVFRGQVPDSEFQRMRAPNQAGEFPFPVKYGYCAVGLVESGPGALVGKHVFALHPHQDVFALSADNLTQLPDDLPPRRATLAANMETALNAVWDSGAGPGDQIIVIGAGLVGLMIARLCAGIPGADVTVLDPQQSRQPVVESFGAKYMHPQQIPAQKNEPYENAADIVFHTSATQEGLESALSMAGFEAKIVEVSWYGDKTPMVALGGAFHSRRLQLVSSQVGHVSPGHRARWPHRRRLEKALALLCDPLLDQLITHEFAFETLPDALPGFLSGEQQAIAAVVRYK